MQAGRLAQQGARPLSGLRARGRAASFTPGRCISDSLRLVRKLGGGGMGDVWAADHLRLGTQVAVKFMAPGIAEDPLLLERFSREAHIVAQIKSPYVVQVLDHSTTTDGHPYIVMELLEGEDLAARVARMGRLTLSDTCAIITQLCSALGRAHALGVIHRDIKPENIFVARDAGPHIKLLDFGIAKVSGGPSHLTEPDMAIGTPRYMSPEQILNPKDVDERADLWSIAVVAYHCLTGALPFTGESYGAICVAVRRGQFVPVTERNPRLPKGLNGWFAKALAREPKERFATAEEISDALVEVVVKATRARDPNVLATRALLALALPVALAAAALFRGATRYHENRALDGAASEAEATRWAHETTTRELAVCPGVIPSGEATAELEREIPVAASASSEDRASPEPPVSWQIMTIEYGPSEPPAPEPSSASPDREPAEP